jgi:hypothetical protein
MHMCVHSFRRCYTRFGAHPNYMHIQIFVKTTRKCFSIKQQHRYGLMSGLAYLMSDCWLEVSLHPEGPATGQLEQRFSVIFLGPRANAVLVPKFHVALHASRTAVQMITLKISPWCSPPNVGLNLLECSPSNTIKSNFPGTWPSRLGESQMRQ